jgi:hypothetical protein
MNYLTANTADVDLLKGTMVWYRASPPNPGLDVLKAFTDIKNLGGNSGELRVGPCFVPSHGYSSV